MNYKPSFFRAPLTTPVDGTKRLPPLVASGSATAGSTPGAFDASLRLEQADGLLRQTDQYAQWQRIRQSSDTQAQQLAELVLQRHALLTNHAEGASINWQALNQLTSQLRQAGINLPLPPDQHPSPRPAPCPRHSTRQTTTHHHRQNVASTTS